MLEMRFLSLPHIAFDGQPLAAFKRSPTLTRLLAFLVTHRDQPQPRLRLAAMFWPALPESRARRTLNNVLWRLRVALGECDSSGAYVLTEGETVQFNGQAPFGLDVREFERLTGVLKETGDAAWHLSSEQLREVEAAVALYRADFLEGIYDDWCEPHRERLRERHLLALDVLSQTYRQGGRADLALHVARQMVQADSYRESAHRRLIESCVAVGQGAEAKVHFERYQAIWRDELGLAPSSGMRELAARHNLTPMPAHAAAQSSARPSVGETAAALEATLGVFTTDADAANAEYLRRELDIRRRCDELYDLMADRKKQAQNLDRAEALANALADPAARVDILARRMWLATRQGEYEQAIALAREALQLCPEGDPAQRALILRLSGIAHQEFGDFRTALAHYSDALALDEQHGQTALIPTDLNNVASIQMAIGDYTGALAHLQRALNLGSTALAPLLAPPVRVKLLGNSGIAWMKLGQLDQAGDSLKQAMTLAQQIGARGAEWWLGARMALLHHLNGDTERALLLAHHHFRAAQSVGDAWVLADLPDVLSQLHCDLGHGEQALFWANELYRHAEARQLWRFRLRSQIRLAAAHRLLGRTNAARAAIERALDLYEKRNQQLEEAAELFSLARVILQAPPTRPPLHRYSATAPSPSQPLAVP